MPSKKKKNSKNSSAKSNNFVKNNNQATSVKTADQKGAQSTAVISAVNVVESEKKSETVSNAKEKKIENQNQLKPAEKLEKTPNSLLKNHSVKKTNPKPEKQDLLINSNNLGAITSVVIGILAIASVLLLNFYVIPEKILTLTESAQAEQDEKKQEDERNQAQKELDEKLGKENRALMFEQNKEWAVNMKIKDFGDLKINMQEKYAPKTVENFVRLTHRGYYNDTKIHRIVEINNPPFYVIQGGDKENGNGTGGRSAFFVNEKEPGFVPDELWEVAPEFNQQGSENIFSNQPKFRTPELYGDLKPDDGTVRYKKGLILMAKTAQPDSASSQFFITLDATLLPAEYTIFGVVDQGSFGVLDKIKNEVDAKAGPAQSQGGEPNKEIKIEEVKISKPEIKN